MPEQLNVLVCVIGLGCAAVGVVALAVLTGRQRRRRDPQRLCSADQKRFLIDQARGRCEHKPPLWRRCPAPGTQADHVVPWSKGGPTQLWNGQLLCSRHNRRKSNALPNGLYRWRLARRRKDYAPP